MARHASLEEVQGGAALEEQERGGVNVVNGACIKVSTEVAHWLETAAGASANAKYRNIALAENYAFLYRSLSGRRIECLADFVGLCEHKAQSHSEAILNEFLRHEFTDMVRFWSSVEECARTNGLEDVVIHVGRAKYEKVNERHDTADVRERLRRIHERLRKYATAEDGFLLEHLWAMMKDKVLASWTRWEELAQACYGDAEGFKPSSEEIMTFLHAL